MVNTANRLELCHDHAICVGLEGNGGFAGIGDGVVVDERHGWRGSERGQRQQGERHTRGSSKRGFQHDCILLKRILTELEAH